MAETISDGTTTLTFIAIEGEIQPPVQQLAEITRPAADGRAYRKTGYKGDPFALRTIVDVDGDTAAGTTIAAYAAFQSKVCSISMRGVNYTNFLCLGVRPISRKKIAVGIGGVTDGTFLVTCEWSFVYADDN